MSLVRATPTTPLPLPCLSHASVPFALWARARPSSCSLDVFGGFLCEIFGFPKFPFSLEPELFIPSGWLAIFFPDFSAEIGKGDQGNHQSGDDVAQAYRNEHQGAAQHYDGGADLTS